MKNLLFTVVAVLTLAFLLPVKTFAGFGISPGGINNESLKKGTQYVQEMIISRSDPDEELNAIIQPDLGEMNGWVTFEPGINVTLPVGVQRVPIKVIINVPVDAAIKDYEGVFRILASPKGEVKGVSVVKGARVDIKLATTEDSVVDLNIRAVSIPDTYEKEDLIVNLTVKNNGNTFVAPSRLQITVLDLLEQEVAELETSDVESAMAYQQSIIKSVIKNHGLSEGEYYGIVKVFIGLDLLYEDRIVFKVFPEKIFEEVCTGAPEIISSYTMPIFIGVSLLGLLVTSVFSYKNFKVTKDKKKLLINLTALIIFVLIMYLMFIKDIVGIIERECSMELVPPTQNSESSQNEETNTPSIEPSSSVQGVASENESSDGLVDTFDELRVGTATEDNKYRVYESGSLSSNVIYLADEGEKFTVIEENSQWYRIQMPDGLDGWLPKVSVKEIEQIVQPD